MTTARTRSLLFTAFICLVTVAAVYWVARLVVVGAAELQAQAITLHTAQAQQDQLSRLQKLATETEADRQTINQQFLQSQSDSIDLLNYIEQLAAEQRVQLETRQVEEVTENGQRFLQMQYYLQASRVQLDRFVRLLENLPHASELTSLTLTAQTDATWQADATLHVLITDTYE